MSDSEQHGHHEEVYIGIEPSCGCVTFVLNPTGQSERQTRIDLKRVIKDGRRVETTTAEDGWKRFTHCEHRNEIPKDVDRAVDDLIARTTGSANA